MLGVDPSKLRYAVTLVDDAYGRAVAQGALDELAARDLHLVGRFGYDPRDVNMHAFVRDLAASRPDVVFVSAYLHDAIVMRREMVRQGLDVLVGIQDVLELLHADVRLHAREGRGRAVRLGQAGVRRAEHRGSHARRTGAVRTRTGRLHATLRRRDDRRGARRVLGRMGAAARRALDRRAADTVGDRDGR